jgi:hypothetical protein
MSSYEGKKWQKVRKSKVPIARSQFWKVFGYFLLVRPKGATVNEAKSPKVVKAKDM